MCKHCVSWGYTFCFLFIFYHPKIRTTEPSWTLVLVSIKNYPISWYRLETSSNQENVEETLHCDMHTLRLVHNMANASSKQIGLEDSLINFLKHCNF